VRFSVAVTRLADGVRNRVALHFPVSVRVRAESFRLVSVAVVGKTIDPVESAVRTRSAARTS
jgi:hypothetical protein